LGKQWAEVDHGTHAHKDQQGEQLGGNSRLVNPVHPAALLVGRHAQVGEDAAHANRQKQDGFNFLCHRKVHQHTAQRNHHAVCPCEIGEPFDEISNDLGEIHVIAPLFRKFHQRLTMLDMVTHRHQHRSNHTIAVGTDGIFHLHGFQRQ